MSPFARSWVGLMLLLSVVALPATADAQPLGSPPEDSPLLRDPDTPEGAFEATLLMVDIARPRLARRYLEILITQMPNDDTLLDLRQKHGAESFLKLSNIPELQPQSVRLLERVNEAFRRRAQDPARVGALLTQLRGSAEEQATAVVSLREGGADVVPLMLQAATSPEFARSPDPIVLAFTKFGSDVTQPLAAATADGVEETQRQVAIESLGYTGKREDLVNLWYPAFGEGQPATIREAARTSIARILRGDERLGRLSTDGVVAELKRVAFQHFSMRTEPGDVEMWTWLPADGRVGLATVPADVAALYNATRYSRQAVALAPEDAEAQALHVAARTGLALAQNGWANGLPIGPDTAHDLAITAGPAVANHGLMLSLVHENPLAALGMLTVLGRIGTENDLHYPIETVSPLVAALDDPDQRVQFAAANTILLIDPHRPFPKASRVVDVLVRAISDDGGGRVAVVDPSVQRGRTMASLFAQLGFVADSARTGRDGFKIASERGDIELVALQANVARWGLTQTIANIRADARTKALPIVVYGDPRFPTNNMEGLKQRYEPIHFVDLAIVREETLLDQVRPFVQATRPQLDPEQRAEMLEAAVYWLAEIARGRRTDVFDIAPAESSLFHLATDDALAEDAMTALAAIPKASAQQRLQELVVVPGSGQVVRTAAATALGRHIREHGMLLTGGQVDAILRAHAGETDPVVASALASVVGTLEPNARRVSDRILTSPRASVLPEPAPAPIP